VPENDQSLFDIAGPEFALRLLQGAGETGTMFAPLKAELFEVNADDIPWVDKLCTPHPIGCYIQKLRFSGKEALVTRRTYVLCERHRSVNHSTFARVKNLPGWKAVSVDRGHDLMVDDPGGLTALLLEELAR
jgi:hypothetical protein